MTEQQFAVIAQSPDFAWRQSHPVNPDRAEIDQCEWRPLLIGTWTECQYLEGLLYTNFQRRGSSIGFRYVVRADVAASLIGKPHNEVTFGGFVRDDEPAPDAPPDNLHIAVSYDGDHYEDFAVAARSAEGRYYAADLPWYDSFAQALIGAEEWCSQLAPGLTTFIVPITCAQELDDHGNGEEHDGNYVHDGEFEHFTWEDGQVVVKRQPL